MMFTSGTTGLAKPVPVPLKAIAAFVGYLRDAVDLREDEAFWNLADPGWAYGLYYAVTGPLALGHATTFYEGPFTVESLSPHRTLAVDWDDELIDTYEAERKPHAWALINMALRIGSFMQPKSVAGAAIAQGLLRLVCLVPAARDYILHLKFKPKPRFKQGFKEQEHGTHAVAIMAAIKAALDPRQLMNPGKIFARGTPAE